VYLAFQAAPAAFFSQLRDTLADVRATDGAFMVFSPLLAVVLGGIISSGNKARLIFWRYRRALPGHYAFSRLAPADPRINMERLRRLVSPWPASPEAENSCWYGIYKRYADHPAIAHTHAAFLLTRDIAVCSLLFLPLGTVGLIVAQRSIRWALVYALVMLVHYLALMVVARNHGQRLVCNVLAEHTTADKPEEGK
jgi:hypothetical protein